MLLSIIIPVYKVEKYLEQCVDSVINQRLENTEIILVDDGSPDRCPEICDAYAKRYNSIKVIHKPNGGLSSARNAGIVSAQGEYLMFLDSDDWWNSEVKMEKILEKVREKEEKEMFLLNSLDYIEGKGIYKRKEHNNWSKISVSAVEDYYQALLDNGNLEVHAATKILKRSFIEKNELYFKEGILSEDNEWMLRVLRNLKKVDIIDEPVYIYRTCREGSISNTIGIRNIKDILDIIKSSIQYYDCKQNEKSLKEKELCYASYLWFSALGLSFNLNRRERQSVRPMFEKTSSVCQYSNSKKTKLCHNVYRIMGFTITIWIFGCYIKINNRYQLNKRK